MVAGQDKDELESSQSYALPRPSVTLLAKEAENDRRDAKCRTGPVCARLALWHAAVQIRIDGPLVADLWSLVRFH